MSLRRKSDNFAFWRCRFKTCRYRVKTNADLSVASVVCTHDHPPKAESLSTSEDVSDESREVSDESKWEIYVSRHEKECLRIDNYCYYKRRNLGDSTTWSCTSRKCFASAKTTDNRLIVMKKQHSHPARSDDFFKSQQIRTGVKRRISLDPSEPPQKAFDIATKSMCDEALEGQDMRPYLACAKRKKKSKRPKLPKSKEEVEESLTRIIDKELTVEGGQLVQEIRGGVVMLGSRLSFDQLTENASHIFGDGTFRFAPKFYKQMFTIHIVKGHIFVPVVYFLLQNKQQRTYRTMFRMLRDKCPDFVPGIAHFDFEVAIQNAFREVFPDAEVRGCRFHLAQAWYRKLASLGLQVTYMIGKSKAAVWLKVCFGLPCLPQAQVLEFFDEHNKSKPQNAALESFAQYLRSNYMSPASSFPPNLWAGCLDGDRINTTNGCENFHRHFGTGRLSPHPSIYDWLSYVNLVHKRNMLKCKIYLKYKQSKKSADLSEHLGKLYDKYNNKELDCASFVACASLNCLPKSRKMLSARSRCVISSIKKKYANTVRRLLTKR